MNVDEKKLELAWSGPVCPQYVNQGVLMLTLIHQIITSDFNKPNNCSTVRDLIKDERTAKMVKWAIQCNLTVNEDLVNLLHGGRKHVGEQERPRQRSGSRQMSSNRSQSGGRQQSGNREQRRD